MARSEHGGRQGDASARVAGGDGARLCAAAGTHPLLTHKRILRQCLVLTGVLCRQVVLSAVSGFVGGRWDATPEGRAKLRREALAERDAAPTILDEPPVGGRG
eukprot:1888510-Rhodomonas_salina.1